MSSAQRKLLYMIGLVMAGEAIYTLPFHVTRFFRPTVLEVFGLTNTELGTAQALYGVVAMLAYFPGGPLADRFPAHKLLAWSLWSTAAGGLYMATLPGYTGALLVWGFFGLSTILLFWAALIRATRDWGCERTQGRAFGLLDGGRGALAALMATLGAGLFGLMFPEGYASAAFEDKQQALRLIIYGYTAVTALAGVFVWFVIREKNVPHVEAGPSFGTRTVKADIALVLRLPAVWLTSLVVICAYVGYKGFDNYSLYAVQGWGLGEVEAAGIAAMGAWMRPIAALAAGLLGDRFVVSRMTAVCFAGLLVSQLVFAWFEPAPGLGWVLLVNILIGSSAIFGLRGLYYALFEEKRVPIAVTGTAVGFVSVLGYTPDIFVSYAGGVILDASPGLAGHQNYFMFLAVFAAIGLVAAWVLMRYRPPTKKP